MTNSEIRRWYQEQVAEIQNLNRQWIEERLSAEQRARQAFEIRHDARLRARAMMENAEDVQALRERDLRFYGNADGPSFDQLLAEFREGGLSDQDTYEKLIKGAQTTNREVDNSLRPPANPPDNA
jgi:hypothetical protein